MSSPHLRRSGVVALATLLAAVALVAPRPAAAAPHSGLGAVTTAEAPVFDGRHSGAAADRQRVRDYWTPQRMRDARPADELLRDLSPPAHRGTAPQPGRQPAGTVAPVAPHRPVPAAPAASGKSTAAGESTGDSAAPGGALAVNASASVGKVFFRNPVNGYDYVCSAATVNSASRLLVMTAGHCVHGGSGGTWMQNWTFVPRYNYGARPYGTWSAKYLTTFTAWANNSNLDRDVGFVTVRPNAAGQRIVSVVGGNGLSWNYNYQQYVTILAYPAAAPYDGGWQQYCRGTTSRPGFWPFLENRIQLRCGFTGGSSGAPWLRNYDDSLGYVNGVMSTLNPSTGWNKSPYFDTAVYNAYASVADRV
ncbi:trypsin-like serine peptidase [Micromonospora sp. LOL_021]|uniref:trypsin-like serine peptidase n=1 Tax=Micromonospora sp. LOL_021 TaxID=3345417 RepID=UPI003A8493D1